MLDLTRVDRRAVVSAIAGVATRFLCPAALLLVVATGTVFAQRAPDSPPTNPQVLWINPLALLPGDPSVTTSFNAVSSGIGGGLSGLVIHSSTTGSQASNGGNKVVETGLEVPLGYLLQGVRVCYESTSAETSIVQIRLAQLQDPPSKAIVLLDDGTSQPAPGPACVNSTRTSIDPSAGAVFLSLRLTFESTRDRIVVRGLGLLTSTGSEVKATGTDPTDRDQDHAQSARRQ